jgi:FKBP-type peptidyl-prolyl cis-trans isomerase FkpA
MVPFSKNIVVSSVLLLALFSTTACQKVDAPPVVATPTPVPTPDPGKVDFKTDDDKISYFIGVATVRSARLAEDLDQMKAHHLAVPNIDLITAGFKDTLNGKSQMTDDELKAVYDILQKREAALAPTPDPVAAAKNEKAGEDFLAANKGKDGVKVTKSGLQYKVVKKGGGGKSPTDTDTVSVNYKGTLVDGTVFDSSDANGGPASFGVNQVIPGWTEGLKLMKEGDKFQFYIPSTLAYGPEQKGPIPPNSTLIFDVELMKINPPQAPH